MFSTFSAKPPTFFRKLTWLESQWRKVLKKAKMRGLGIMKGNNEGEQVETKKNKCSYCKLPGHTTRTCTSKKNDEAFDGEGLMDHGENLIENPVQVWW